jgi:hypothetical protein
MTETFHSAELRLRQAESAYMLRRKMAERIMRPGELDPERKRYVRLLSVMFCCLHSIPLNLNY